MIKPCKYCGEEVTIKGRTCMKCHSEKMSNLRRDKRTAAVELLGNKCADCGQTYPHAVYDFHHLSNKYDCVSVLIHNNRKLETILEEAEKCELLCSNCHRIRHYK